MKKEQIEKWLYSKLLFFGAAIGVCSIWQALELFIYGEAEYRLVDDIMFIIWTTYAVATYDVGVMVGRGERTKKERIIKKYHKGGVILLTIIVDWFI